MSHIFTYGSLMFNEVWQQIVQEQYRSAPCRLNGYRRYSVINEDYPAIVPGSEQDNIDGIIYLDICDSDLSRLDIFEGEYYQRREVKVSTNKNIFIAQTYILKDQYKNILASEAWDPEYFRVSCLYTFMETYSGILGSQ